AAAGGREAADGQDSHARPCRRRRRGGRRRGAPAREEWVQGAADAGDGPAIDRTAGDRMNRRDFLTLRNDGSTRMAVLSCERLSMRYVDAETEGTTAALFAHLTQCLRSAANLRLIDTSWLACGDLKVRLDSALRAAGHAESRSSHS